MDFSSFSYFNPRLREGGDNSTRLSINSCFVFQSTPPRRRRLFHLVNLLLYKEISIHASEKEATTLQDYQLTPALYFNPRLREGGDPGGTKAGRGINISIHASEKEATPPICYNRLICDISIHASEKEATATYCDTSTIMYISSLNNFFVRYF